MKMTRQTRFHLQQGYFVVFVTLATACGGGGDVPQTELVAVTELAPGTPCALGGVSIVSGADTDRDGVLAPTEVVSTHTVCNGVQSNPAAVVSATMLPIGSDECPLGGSTIRSGLDNGDGGGTAANGSLESGEVDATVVVCSGEPAGAYDLSPPVGVDGTAYLLMNGGNATGSGAGGAGGTLTLGDPSFSAPSSYAIYRTGEVDIAHVEPTLTFDGGSDPLIVAGATSLAVAPAPVSCVGTTVYIDQTVTPNKLVRCHAAATNFYTAVTGIDITKTGTLTFATTSSVELSDDVRIAGVLTSLPDGANIRQAISIAAKNIEITSTGSVALAAVFGSPSGQAGALSLSAAGTLVNFGTIETYGNVHGATVSAGKNVSLAADSLHQRGFIATNGASLPTVNGSAAGSVSLSASRMLLATGEISAIGGSGNGGGSGGAVTIALTSTHRLGPQASLVSTALISTRGGACDQAGSSAGAGGKVTIGAVNGFVRHAGSVTTTGGSSDLAATQCSGGNGGALAVYATSADDGWDATSMVDLGGPIALSGGDGGSAGGNSGSFLVAARRPRGGLARLFGYGSGFSLAGGSGGGFSGAGGAAGKIEHATTQGTGLGLYPTFIPEQVHLYPAILAQGGGAGGLASGGAGGSISIVHASQGATSITGASTAPALLIAGDVDLTPGAGFGAGASPGLFYSGYGDVRVSAAVTAEGGGGFGTGTGGTVSINTTGAIVMSGTLLVNARPAALAGSEGGSVVLVGQQVLMSGTISARGGSSTSQRAGDGGSVEIQSLASTSNVSGTIDVAAGTTEAPDGLGSAALPGVVVIDGLGI